MTFIEFLILIIGGLAAITAFLGMVGGAIATRYWIITGIFLSILKLTGVLQIMWFGTLFTLSALGTPLWMLFGGLFMILFNMGVLALMGILLDNA